MRFYGQVEEALAKFGNAQRSAAVPGTFDSIQLCLVVCAYIVDGYVQAAAASAGITFCRIVLALFVEFERPMAQESCPQELRRRGAFSESQRMKV